jgi:hypothetical protein
MFHWLVAGPIPYDRMQRALDEYGRDVGPFLSYDAGGYLICRWAEAPLRLWERVKAFAHFLARREGAVVLDERMEPAAAPPRSLVHPPVQGPRKRAGRAGAAGRWRQSGQLPQRGAYTPVSAG